MSDSQPRIVMVAGESLAPSAESLLRNKNLELVFSGTNNDKASLLTLLSDSQADGIILREGAIDDEVLAASRRLKVIANHGAGYDTIDVAAATNRGIPVFVAYGRNARSVAEQALTLILALHKDVLNRDRLIRNGDWRGNFSMPTEFSDKTLGIIGFGPTGRELARLVQPFGVDTIVHDPYVDETDLPKNTQFAASINALTEAANVVSLHVPLTDKTNGMVNRDFLNSMKPGSLLINTSRGPVINEEDLIDVLMHGPLTGAGLDTFIDEPISSDNELLALPNVVLSPHIAGVTHECIERMSLSVAKNTISILRSQDINLEDLLNREVLE